MAAKKAQGGSGGALLNTIFLVMLLIVLLILYFNSKKEYAGDAVYSVNAGVDGVIDDELDEPSNKKPPPTPRKATPITKQQPVDQIEVAEPSGKDAELPPPTPVRVGDTTKTAMIRHDYSKLGLKDYCGTQKGEKPTAESATCELAILYSQNCKIEEGQEDYLQCLKRIGPSRFLPLLPTKCTQTKFFKHLLEQEAENGKSNFNGRLKRGLYEANQVYTDEKVAYIPPKDRPGSKFGPPRTCSNGCKHYPISFSMPKSNVVKRVSRTKIWDFLPYVPGQFPIPVYNAYYFDYNDEWLSHTIHRHSMYAFTHKRGGWDCMRHLEIMSAGTVPYFVDIDNLPENSLSHMPKDLIKEAMALEGVAHIGRVTGPNAVHNAYLRRNRGGVTNFNKPGTVQGFNKTFNMKAYYKIADKIHEHVKEYMTTRAMVSHMLRTINHEEPKRVLIIGRYLNPSGYDYLHVSIEHGFSDLGINTTIVGGSRDFVMKMKKDTPNAEDPMLDPPLNGVTTPELEKYRLSRVVPPYVAGLIWQYGFRELPHVARHDPAAPNDARIAQQILDGEFDLVVYTFVEARPVNQNAYWSSVSKAMDKSRIIFVHHHDDGADPDRGIMAACQFGTVFKREMHDAKC